MRWREIKGRVKEAAEDVGRYYDPDSDEFDKADADQDRKPRVTLRILNKLKRNRIAAATERENKKGLLSTMYGVPKTDVSQ
jgi:hypothetical protein